MKTKLVILVLAALTVTAKAQTRWAINVHCQPTSPDFIGDRICSAVRDRIAVSPRMLLDSSSTYWTLHVLTIDPMVGIPGESNHISVATVMLTRDDKLVAAGIHSCGISRVKECADGIFADLDNAINGN